MASTDPPTDLEVRRVRSGEPEMVLVSFTTSETATLAAVECEIALAVLRGLSNAAIATERGVAIRTVANQVASIFKKLGVSSRTELASRLSVADFR